MKQVSIVIPTYNRVELLPRVTEGLRHQTGDIDYEVIFVIDGANDGTKEYLDSVAIQYPGLFRVFFIEPTGGASTPRNVGIRHATGKILIILDDDVIPDPDLVLQHWNFHRDHPAREVAVLGEAYVPGDVQTDPMCVFHAIQFYEARKLEHLTYFHFWTCNVSLKRDFMLEYGMFDESIPQYEDVECGYRLHLHGMKLHFVPQARGSHLHKLSPTAVPRKGVINGHWLFRAVECIPDLEFKKRCGIFSPEVPVASLIRTAILRSIFYLVANPITFLILRASGAEKPKRSRVSDLYYLLIYRRNMLAGYYEAKRAFELTSAPLPA
jgi:glycosyltransferase involved in cell wall biosynthesis